MIGNETPKRILVADCLSHFGGVHRVMVNLLPILARSFDIRVVDPYGNAAYRKAMSRKGLAVADLGLGGRRPFIGGGRTWKRLFCMLKALPRLLKMRRGLAETIVRFDPHYVYTNQQPMLRMLGRIAATRGRQLVYHAHGFGQWRDIQPSAVRILNAHDAIVMPVSDATGRQLCRAGVREELIALCYNGVDVEEVERLADAGPQGPVPDKPTGQVVLLLPATLQPAKGQHVAVEALARARRAGADVALWLAGDVAPGGDKTYLPSLQNASREWGVADRVHFLGWRDDLFGVMTEADAVMLCSQEGESFGMVFAEAMVLRKPCLGPRIGGVPEVIDEEHTGLLFDPQSARDVAAAMHRVAADEALRRRFGQAGRARVEACFTVAHQVARIADALNSATDTRTVPR